ncbi:MAG TPA: hypothetical protein V6D09_24990 [Leptolyngbyaceae cyanobacterium]
MHFFQARSQSANYYNNSWHFWLLCPLEAALIYTICKSIQLLLVRLTKQSFNAELRGVNRSVAQRVRQISLRDSALNLCDPLR